VVKGSPEVGAAAGTSTAPPAEQAVGGVPASGRRLLRRVVGGNLWESRDFLRLWGGQTVSMIGGQVTHLALPTAAITIFHATAFDVGLLQSMRVIPFLLLAIPLGVLVDRRRRRPLLVLSNLAGFVILGSIPLFYVLGLLTLAQLFVVTALASAFNVLFLIAYQAYLPDLVARSDLVEANSKLQLSLAGSNVAGPGIAGVLIQAIGAAGAIVVDAFSFLVSAWSFRSIEHEERDPAPRSAQTRRGSLISGLRAVVDHPILRRTIAQYTLVDFGLYTMQAVILVFALRELGLAPVTVGVIYAIGGVGFAVGALAAPFVNRRIGLGPMLAIGALLLGVGFAGLGLARYAAPVAILAIAQLVLTSAWPIYSIAETSVRQGLTPHDLQGRVTGFVRMLTLGVAPLAASVLGGLLAETVSAFAALVTAGAITGLGILFVLDRRILGLRELPSPVVASEDET
jgi:MFS family permease